ncbi:tRNA (guanine(37)-N1)-methyltransferase-like [Mya arenaria]|uniref:tRNA (guanine(37)-N1)-methyltransferase-like n=1 Tax=Mya arenaria TaxID=6604 RepID=UPI0022E24D49|nr:tRNA (guanine(37)-N1)-methyltransferase-like [Mya arenaria]
MKSFFSRIILGRLFRPVIVRKPPSSTVNVKNISKKKISLRTGILPLQYTHILTYQFKFRAVNPTVMAEPNNALIPPSCVRGMKVLDKLKFDTIVSVRALIVEAKQLSKVLKCIKKYMLKMPKVNSIVDVKENDPCFKANKLVLLDSGEIQQWDDFDVSDQEFLSKENLNSENLKTFDLALTYDNWNFSEIMTAILPQDSYGVSGFEEVGHIAHFNLREKNLPYKNIIGEVLLDKKKHLKTVVNKLDTIDSTFRTFQMELLAGEGNFVTQTKENGVTFELDYSKVYWNSRLGTEHERIVKMVEVGDVVFDVFAGIGPFAVPAARKRVTVFANDLNPHSYEYLVKNTKLNKCKDSIKCYNLDGREFIYDIVKNELIQIYTSLKNDPSESSGKIGISVIMNLPALAYTFLNAFDGLLSSSGITVPNTGPLPRVHCYCFTDIEEAKKSWDGDMVKEVKQRTLKMLGGLVEDDITVRQVRNVAPQKEMMCITFSLTPDVLMEQRISSETREGTDHGAPAPKMARLDT